jgi:hypothetical protein
MTGYTTRCSFGSQTLPGATSFLAEPACTLYNGDLTAGAAGQYLNPFEIHLTDGGFDAAGIGTVINLNRSVGTGALGATWIGHRVQSIGSTQADSAFSASGAGGFKFGLDLSNASFDANAAAITLAANQRIYGNATGGNFFPSGVGTSYFGYASAATGWQFTTGGAVGLTITTSYVGVVNPSGVNTGDRFGVVGSSAIQLGMTIDNSNAGATAQTTLNIGNNTSTNEVAITLNGGGFSGGAGANAFTINAKGGMVLAAGVTGIQINTSGVVMLPNTVTGTPVASLCLDASNNIIKKTTTGSCI